MGKDYIAPAHYDEKDSSYKFAAQTNTVPDEVVPILGIQTEGGNLPIDRKSRFRKEAEIAGLMGLVIIFGALNRVASKVCLYMFYLFIMALRPERTCV